MAITPCVLSRRLTPKVLRLPLGAGRAGVSTLAQFRVPDINNEPNKHYEKGSTDRQGLLDAIKSLQSKLPINIPAVVAGKEIEGQDVQSQFNPSDHAQAVAHYSQTTSSDINAAIDAALAAKPAWEALPFADRAAIFLKAADLISTKYRFELMAATMLGQGKNAWQAEIDAAAETIDFLRFNVRYAQDLYATQPAHNAAGVWNRVEYRPLEGFVYAVSPFNFTAIGANLAAAPALLGNVVVWKPSPSAVLSNSLVHKILLEAGLPPDVIQFCPGDAEQVTATVLARREFAALHYTGSTPVFRQLCGRIGAGVAEARFRAYPRVVAETGGKNFHLLHPSADPRAAALQTVRAAFEFQGQKCSACSRAYVPASLAEPFRDALVEQTEKLAVGPPTRLDAFVGPVIHAASFRKLKAVIDDARDDPGLTLLAGGTYDDGEGYFVHPTVYLTRDADHHLLRTELFGPILVLHVYDDSPPGAFESVCRDIDASTDYALTGAVFARDRAAVRRAEDLLRDAAGNFYVNTKCTGAVVGQQPFGGARASGTNDKAGSQGLLSRFVSARAIKEEFLPIGAVEYPSNLV